MSLKTSLRNGRKSLPVESRDLVGLVPHVHPSTRRLYLDPAKSNTRLECSLGCHNSKPTFMTDQRGLVQRVIEGAVQWWFGDPQRLAQTEPGPVPDEVLRNLAFRITQDQTERQRIIQRLEDAKTQIDDKLKSELKRRKEDIQQILTQSQQFLVGQRKRPITDMYEDILVPTFNETFRETAMNTLFRTVAIDKFLFIALVVIAVLLGYFMIHSYSKPAVGVSMFMVIHGVFGLLWFIAHFFTSDINVDSTRLAESPTIGAFTMNMPQLICFVGYLGEIVFGLVSLYGSAIKKASIYETGKFGAVASLVLATGSTLNLRRISKRYMFTIFSIQHNMEILSIQQQISNAIASAIASTGQGPAAAAGAGAGAGAQ